MAWIEAVSASQCHQANTEEMRSHFLCEDLKVAGEIRLVHWEVDRTVIGVAMPTAEALELGAPSELRCAYFCERRELGVVNLGGPGQIVLDGAPEEMGERDFAYVSRGTRSVAFAAADADNPPIFYFVSHPAHAEKTSRVLHFAGQDSSAIGERARCNERRIYPVISPKNVDTCQLVMGITLLPDGSVWNTMAPHTHPRRSEVYFYFGLEENGLVVHLMGEPDQTRHLIVRQHQAVVSPGWSIHAGAGTGPYGFIWAMGGENQEFTDMDPVDPRDLR